MRYYLLLFALLINKPLGLAQPAWDDDKSKDWPEAISRIEIPSSLDGEIQPAYFYASKAEGKRPLIVSLHTWSGGYDQKDVLAKQCLEKDYNYIHPHFRGPNNTPKACGSPFVIADIDDAITYALENGHVDPHQIHVIGASGGGYATLLAYMKSGYDIKTFSAWVPISNIEDWYYESKGRGTKYAQHILSATSSKKGRLNTAEAGRRSPALMETPIEQRKNSKLYIYAGVHDGYKGSVPITQSIHFYNKVVQDYGAESSSALVPQDDILTLLGRRNYPVTEKAQISDRVIHYQKAYKNRVQLTLFEGKHEMLPEVALNHVGMKNILAIGDSNGAAAAGWVNQLSEIRVDDFFYNACISGNTIGFDNLGTTRLNQLKNTNKHLKAANEELGGIDAIIVMLGTNDCKAVFQDSLKQVPINLEKLIAQIKKHEVYQKSKPKIYIVSPPPFGPDEMLIEKYKGGLERVSSLQAPFRAIAQKENCVFIDTFSKIKGTFPYLTTDGVHFTREGHRIVAEIINSAL